MAIILKDIKPELYQEAFSNNMTLSSYLETLDPTEEGASLDRFEEIVAEAGIRTNSVPSKNLTASTVDSFYRTNESKVMFPEYVARTLIKTMQEFPLYSYLVGVRTGIEGSVYEASYLDLTDPKNKKNLEMRRVAEAADLPKAVLKLGESVIRLYKYGRAVGVSYEALRRMSLELFQRNIRLIAANVANNKVDEILSVIKDGDGNDNAAPVVKMTEIETGAKEITSDVLIDFLLSFEDIGGADTIIADKKAFKQILKVLYPLMENAGTENRLISKGYGVSVALPQNLISNFTLLCSDKVPKVGSADAVYAFNRDMTIEEVYELKSTIQEADINVINQTKELTISENSGFRKMFKESAKVLTLN